MNISQANIASSGNAELQDAFSVFNQVSSDLGNYFKLLEGKVDKLNRELVASRSERIRELTEKEKLAAKLSSLMDALPAGLIVLDQDYTILEENPQAVELLGKSLTGTSWQDLVTSSDSSKPLLSGEFNYEDGRRLSVSHNQYGQGKETLLLLTDITESHRLASRVNREARLSALGEMAARLAHQIRTPLTTAILYLSHLSGGRQMNIRESETVQKILDRMRQIERQIEGMLSYIRGESIVQEEFCLTGLLKEVKEATLAQVEKREGSLALNIKTGLTTYRGDREALLNAISNLVENSLQTDTQQPLIVISLNSTENGFTIKVKDNGPGFAQSIEEKMFDPFFSTKTNGNGLGLAVATSAVKAHGGELHASNDPLGGAVLELVLPLRKAEELAQ